MSLIIKHPRERLLQQLSAELSQPVENEVISLLNIQHTHLFPLGNKITSFLNTQDTALFPCVSREWRAVMTFWGLKSNWWMQVIDGEYHQHGPLVFDHGRHRNNTGQKEPGFFESILSAASFVSSHLRYLPSIEMHKLTNQHACAHFRGIATQTAMSAKESGTFRIKATRCGIDIYQETTEAAKRHYRVWKFFLSREQDAHLEALDEEEVKKRLLRYYGEEEAEAQLEKRREMQKKTSQITLQKYAPKKEAAFAFVETWSKMWDERILQANLYIQEVSASLGLDSPLASIHRYDDYIQVRYPPDYFKDPRPCCEQVADVANQITERFNQEIAQAQTQEEKIRCIAKLFQLREWLHAFRDGNTRTNLVELAGLLSQHGLNPAILEQPFEASLLHLDAWVEYLKSGMERWQMNHEKYKTLLPKAIMPFVPESGAARLITDYVVEQ